MTEQELIKGCIRKIPHYQRHLFDRYAGTMMSLCQRYAGNKQEAQDILQEGFIRLFDHLHKFSHQGSFDGWVRKLFVNVALRYISKANIVFSDIETANNFDNSVWPTVISKLSESEIHELIRKLPDGYRIVFNLNIIEGYTHDEIADLLQITASTSRTQLLKARKVLKSLILHQKNLIEI